MDPVLKDVRTKFPSVTTVHFWSDGPSKQYKNRKNFFLLSEVPPTLGFDKTTWNYFPTSHGKGAPGGIGGKVKTTADKLVLQGNDLTDGKEFSENISNSLNGVELYHIEQEDMEKYDTLLTLQLKQVPSTRKIHQVIPHQNSVRHRQLSCFCSEPLNCQCFSPATFCLHSCTEEQQTDAKARKKGPLAMLMEEIEFMEEEMEEEPLKGPEGSIVEVTIDSIEDGDWLAVVYDDHWWLAKAIDVDTEHQDVKVEFLHPHGPTANAYPKHGRRDVCFCPGQDILLKLTGKASPLQSSRTRELYSIAPDVMDFIERKHVRRLLPNA